MRNGRDNEFRSNYVPESQIPSRGPPIGPQVSFHQRLLLNQQRFPNSPLLSQQREFHANQFTQQPLHAPTCLKSALKKKELTSEVSTSLENTPACVQLNIIAPIQIQQPDDPMDPEARTCANKDMKIKTLITRGKISKKEKRGRLNKRLRSILMPKNALMILNELRTGIKFTFIEKELQTPCENSAIYIASVTIDGTEHTGCAKSKIAAKTVAAENALRHIFLSKIGSQRNSTPASSDSEGDCKMDGGEEKSDEDEVSWLHVASFAMHKLFTSWYADVENKSEEVKETDAVGEGDMTSQFKEAKTALANFTRVTRQHRSPRPLPEDAHLINPVMLLNQIRDDVYYEEVCKDGIPPNIIFTLKSIVDGWVFFGRGSNKKIARRNCAYAVCSKLYNLIYPAEEFDPTATMCSPIGSKESSIMGII